MLIMENKFALHEPLTLDSVLGFVTLITRSSNQKGLDGVKISNMRLVKQPTKPFEHHSFFTWDEEKEI